MRIIDFENTSQNNFIASKTAKGVIKLGDFEERFCASLLYWDQDEYSLQWKEGVERILRGKEKSALITSMHDPENANFINWWVLHRLKDVVFFQEQILFLNQLKEKFNENNVYEHITDRETISEDGYAISEWSVPICELN